MCYSLYCLLIVPIYISNTSLIIYLSILDYICLLKSPVLLSTCGWGMVSTSQYDVTYKILVLGESNVGKTSLIHRFTDAAEYQDNFIATIGLFPFVTDNWNVQHWFYLFCTPFFLVIPIDALVILVTCKIFGDENKGVLIKK